MESEKQHSSDSDDTSYDEEESSYESSSRDEDEPENCKLCKEKFGSDEGQKRSTAACGHVLHAYCLNQFSHGTSCPVCEDLRPNLYQQVRHLKFKLEKIKRTVTDLESTVASQGKIIELLAQPTKK